LQGSVRLNNPGAEAYDPVAEVSVELASVPMSVPALAHSIVAVFRIAQFPTIIIRRSRRETRR